MMESDDNLSIGKLSGVSKTPIVPINFNNNKILNINVSGQRFELQRETLLKYPSTRLGKIAKSITLNTLYDGYDKIKNEFYFEREPTCFSIVIAYYVTGTLHVPRYACINMFETEIKYWGLPFKLECCCQGYHQQEWDVTETVKKTNKLFQERRNSKKPIASRSTINLRQERCLVVWKRRTWDLFENNESSVAATVVSLLSTLMVIVSTITLCVNTHPKVQVILADGTKADNPKLVIVEIICMVWFTIEYICRAVSCPNKKQFMRSLLNAIDLLAILPFYIGIIMENLNGDVDDSFTNVRRFVQILRIFRVVRIFKVARHSTGLQVLGYTVKNSKSELGLLFMLLLMGMTLFSCLVYYAEQDDKDTQFESIIAAFWWAVITMTTVGYGDMYPRTPFGQVIGSFCCVSGIIFIALPIPTIVSNFSAFYKDHLNKEKLEKLYGMPLIDVDLKNSSEILHKNSKTSIFHVNALAMQELSMTQMERHDHYRRQMSESGTVSAMQEDNV